MKHTFMQAMMHRLLASAPIIKVIFSLFASSKHLSNSPECRNLSKTTIFSNSVSTLSTSTNLSAQALAWGSRLRDHRPPQHKPNLTSQLLRATFLPDSLLQSVLWTTSSMHVQRFNLPFHFISFIIIIRINPYTNLHMR